MSVTQEPAGGSVEPESSRGRGRVVAVLLVTWLVANSLTHVVVALATGDTYYKLPLYWMIGAEASIAFLNFVLPILAVRYLLKEPVSFRSSFGWRWTGWKIPVLGIGGFVAVMLLSMGTDRLFGTTIQYGAAGMAGPVTRANYLVFTLMLLIFPAFGEETMFRGFLQTRMTAMYGATAGILIPAVLFAIRHHPSDIYFGVVNHVPAAGWANRAIQLYAGAVIFGLARHFARSTWASWLLHVLIILMILVFGGFFRQIFS